MWVAVLVVVEGTGFAFEAVITENAFSAVYAPEAIVVIISVRIPGEAVFPCGILAAVRHVGGKWFERCAGAIEHQRRAELCRARHSVHTITGTLGTRGRRVRICRAEAWCHLRLVAARRLPLEGGSLWLNMVAWSGTSGQGGMPAGT